MARLQFLAVILALCFLVHPSLTLHAADGTELSHSQAQDDLHENNVTPDVKGRFEDIPTRSATQKKADAINTSWKLSALGYQKFDACISEESETPQTCSRFPRAKSRLMARHSEKPLYRLIGFHGTSETAARNIIENGLRANARIVDGLEKNQYGPGFYVTDHIATAGSFATAAAKSDKSKAVLLDVWAKDFDTMTAHIFTKEDGIVVFGKEPYLAATAQSFIDDYDYLAGPHHSMEGEAVQIKFNPRAFGKLLITRRPDKDIGGRRPFSRPVRRIR
ncbi:hypothetical protein BKA69DRAFT_1040801 [Paraphysoderma sedebokerense]|nr:hypothetical protein BKA69DRAFT_1127591 [Paraphysoderma sedebokerense]KAI9138611.1 hypothetical protein BKA69DRAFT_1040801 [Paraphysoderma sedebokerense]